MQQRPIESVVVVVVLENPSQKTTLAALGPAPSTTTSFIHSTHNGQISYRNSYYFTLEQENKNREGPGLEGK